MQEQLLKTEGCTQNEAMDAVGNATGTSGMINSVSADHEPGYSPLQRRCLYCGAFVTLDNGHIGASYALTVTCRQLT